MSERQRVMSKAHGDREVLTNKQIMDAGLVMAENDFSVFNKKGLDQVRSSLTHAFENSSPFPYFGVRHLLPWDLATWVHRDFPTPKEYSYERVTGEDNGDFRFSLFMRLPLSVQRVINEVSHPLFLEFLEDTTSIKGLIPDPYLEDAGLEYTTKGAERVSQKSREKHSKLGLYRRVTLLFSFNKSWEKEWGGSLEFSGDEGVKELFMPQFNYFVCYDSMKAPAHGFKPLMCPTGHARLFISLHLYSVNKN